MEDKKRDGAEGGQSVEEKVHGMAPLDI